MRRQDHPVCRQCKHYFITWDPRHPYGCRAFGMKSRKIPSMEVFRVSGTRCMVFEMKEARKPPNKKKSWKWRG